MYLLPMSSNRYLEILEEPTLVEAKSGTPVKILTYDFYVPNFFIYFILEDQCKQDMNYTLKFPYFKGELSTDLEGLYRSEYKEENGNNV